MKKLIVMLAVVSLALVSRAGDELSYVVVGNKTYFSNDVKVGVTHVRIHDDNGTLIRESLKNVDAWMVDGRLCERMPVVCPDGKVRCTALMELVCQRGGLRLYKFCAHKGNNSLGCCFRDKTGDEAIYYVYKDKELHLRVDEKNAGTVFPFFHVTYLAGK